MLCTAFGYECFAEARNMHKICASSAPLLLASWASGQLMHEWAKPHELCSRAALGVRDLLGEDCISGAGALLQSYHSGRQPREGSPILNASYGVKSRTVCNVSEDTQML